MVGFGEKFDKIVAELERHPEWGIHQAVTLDPQGQDIAILLDRIRWAIVDEVYIASPRQTTQQVQIDQLLIGLENLGLPVRVALNFDELQSYYGQYASNLGSSPGVLLSPYNLDPDQIIIKRLMDVGGAMAGLLLAALLFPFIGIAIKLDSPGPVFFTQIRIGKGGRKFRIYKFRTMFIGAENRQQELLQDNIHVGPMFKVEGDPRITRVGRILRKCSLDEFPQFLNVLTGDMSLVGTRPPTPEEVSRYQDHHFRRISIKPGITGLWQVSGRNRVTDFDDVVTMDVDYISNWSPWLDLKIILQTVWVVLTPGGAAM
jgi:exopolysaccharide biosynthesis polyprenyl glycosylphosphotransferase